MTVASLGSRARVGVAGSGTHLMLSALRAGARCWKFPTFASAESLLQKVAKSSAAGPIRVRTTTRLRCADPHQPQPNPKQP